MLGPKTPKRGTNNLSFNSKEGKGPSHIVAKKFIKHHETTKDLAVGTYVTIIKVFFFKKKKKNNYKTKKYVVLPFI